MDKETACALAQHERNHLLYARGLSAEDRAHLEAKIVEFERSHGVEGSEPDSRRIAFWSWSSDVAVNPNVAAVRKAP
jgi:uncharacterized protein YaeQ